MYDESGGLGLYQYNGKADIQRNLYEYAGTTDAPYTGGFINTLNYHNWELSFNFAYNLGAHVRTAPSYSVTEYDPGHNTNRDILNRWTTENRSSKLQNIRLAYTLPQEWLHKFNVKGATIGLEGRNLFVFGSSYKNYLDPESMGNLYSTPVAKSVTFNLNLNF